MSSLSEKGPPSRQKSLRKGLRRPQPCTLAALAQDPWPVAVGNIPPVPVSGWGQFLLASGRPGAMVPAFLGEQNARAVIPQGCASWHRDCRPGGSGTATPGTAVLWETMVNKPVEQRLWPQRGTSLWHFQETWHQGGSGRRKSPGASY